MGYTVKFYTYVDRYISRRIACSVLNSLRQQHPLQLPASSTRVFDKSLLGSANHHGCYRHGSCSSA